MAAANSSIVAVGIVAQAHKYFDYTQNCGHEWNATEIARK